MKKLLAITIITFVALALFLRVNYVDGNSGNDTALVVETE